MSPYGGLAGRRAERNAVRGAARKAAAVTLASTIGVFGSSQIAFAADIAAIVADPPVIEAPGQALADSPLPAGTTGGSASGSATGNASATSGTTSATAPAPSEPDADAPSAPAADAVECDDGHTVGTGDGDIGTVPMSPMSPMAVAEASFAERVNEALAASSEAVITLSESETLDTQLTIPAGKQLTIDLNGCTLSCSGGTPFVLNDASTLIVIDKSASKDGVISTGGSTLLTQDDNSYEKANFTLLNGHISCSSLASGVNCMQLKLSGGSVSMSACMNVPSNVWVEIKGACTVTSSASDTAFRISSGGSVEVEGGSKLTYTGAGSVFTMNRGGALTLGGNSGVPTVTASSGNIVLFANASVSTTYKGAHIVCGKDHPAFTSSAGVTGVAIKFDGGVLPDDSIKNYLGANAFCVHVPGEGFVVRDQEFVNENCVGVANGVYYYSEADFASATGEKMHFELVEFSLDGAKQHIYVQPGTKLCDAPDFTLAAAPAKDGYTFSWVRSSTGAKYTQAEVLNLPIVASGQAYSFVGKYEANAVTPPGPVEPDPPTPPGPVDPGPVGPVDPVDPGPVVPVNPGPSGPGDVIDAPSGGTGGGAGASRGLTPARPWMPADLALAAGFVVPESGAGVVVLDEFGQPVVAGAEAGAGDGDGDGAAGSLYDADDPDGGRISFTVGDALRVLALGSGVVLAALIVARVGAFMGANAGAGVRGRSGRKRKPVT